MKKQAFKLNSIFFLVNSFIVTSLSILSLFSFNYLIEKKQKQNFARGNSGNSASLNSLNTLNNNQWGLSTINIENAWLLTGGKDSVRVGVIDTGVWAEHEDLQDNLNTSYDVCYSIDFSTSMYDTDGHGTHVIGILGASNNSIGIDGVCKKVSITPYRVSHSFYLDNSWYDTACISSLNDAELQGIDLINFSGSYFEDTYDFREAFENFDGLIVCAAGNNTTNNDLHLDESYPSTYDFDNIISVGASNEDDEPWDFSNYGQHSVDLFAPGDDIYSTLPFDSYDYYDGTSMAAPFVTGTIALMKSINPSLSNSQIKSILLSTVDVSSNYTGMCLSGGRLNAYSAVKASIPSLSLGNNSSIQPLDENDFQWYTFIVPNGNYNISSSGNLNLSASLYSNPLSSPLQTASPDNLGNFSLNFGHNNSSNTRFYLKIVNNSSVLSGNYGLSFTNLHTHHYYDHFVNYGPKHHSYCSCGAYINEFHIMTVDMMGNTCCVLCGATGNIGPLNYSCFNNYQIIGKDSHLLNNGSIVLSDYDYQAFLENGGYINIFYAKETD